MGLTNVGGVYHNLSTPALCEESVKRFKIVHSRTVIRDAISGALDGVGYDADPHLGFAVPREGPRMPAELLNPLDTPEDKAAYDEEAKHLAGLSVENFKEFAGEAPAEVGAAGPVA